MTKRISGFTDFLMRLVTFRLGDYYFYERRNLLKTYIQLSDLVNNRFTFYPNVFESLESIAPSGLPFGVSQDRLVEKLGSPAYRLINEKAIPSHTVLFYKKSIDGMVLIYQYHFIESRMFFVSFGI